MAKNIGHLTEGLASTLRMFNGLPGEFSLRFNTGKRLRRLRVLKRRGLLKELSAWQKGCVTYQLTPAGMGALDRWATERKDNG